MDVPIPLDAAIDTLERIDLVHLLNQPGPADHV